MLTALACSRAPLPLLPPPLAARAVQWLGDFTHATVRGSGHMVPTHKPYSAFLLLQNWLSGAGWPSLPAATEPRKSLWRA